MPDLPSNVKLQKWLPQLDLLGHPKIKLFITHGGLLSTLESTYNGVPVIGMPIFADQESNMKEVESEGWGRVMMWKKLEENTFRELILEMLNNKKVIEIAKQKSVLMKDRLVPPDEEAAYWVEYVMRHKGANHIKSPVFMMYWYEIYNIDVWAFITLVIVGILFVSYLLIKFLLKKCFGIGKSKNNKSKKE
ncbi:UDP-glucuronosyltransferase 1-1 [Armadillidium vulgare]|nr:UDP-glucuronosyltransferase 1-1 [Armadillidium vulgare]